MIRFIFSILLLICSGVVYGQGVIVLQDKPFVYKDNRDTAVWNRLAANSTFRSLSTMEQEFFYWSNLMRKNPSGFGETVLKEFLIQFPEANSAESRSLITDLKQIKTILMGIKKPAKRLVCEVVVFVVFNFLRLRLCIIE